MQTDQGFPYVDTKKIPGLNVVCPGIFRYNGLRYPMIAFSVSLGRIALPARASSGK